MEWLIEQWAMFATWSKTPDGMYWQQVAVILVFVFALLAVVSGHYRFKDRLLRGLRRRRGRQMGKQERAEMVQHLIEDGITDIIEDLEYAGKITREEAQAWYLRLGESSKLPGLLPKCKLKHRERLKTEIKKRLSSGEYGRTYTFPLRKARNALEAVFFRKAQTKS